MRKTLALFGLAFALLVTALVVGLRSQPVPPTPQPPDIPRPEPPLAMTGASTAQLGDLVRMTATLSNDYAPADQVSELSLLMELTADQQSTSRRLPMALALVIDRSGSMAGEKLSHAKRAARQLISRLSDEDQIAIVSYSSDYAVNLPLTRLKGQRARTNRVIEDILDGGGTDLAGGLTAGLRTLRRADSSTLVRRVILMSDGNANQGITAPAAIQKIARRARQDGITVSTLGVGLDFNEDLMTAIAESAGGGYYYVRDATSIARAFDEELADLSKLAARNVEVGLELGPDVSIKEIFGYRTEMRRGRVVIPVGDMAAGERRKVMVRLQAPMRGEGPMPVTGLVLSYASAASQELREHQAALSINVTSDHHAIEGARRPPVEEAFAEATAARARKEAASVFQSGDKKRALRHLKSQLNVARKKSKRLKSKSLRLQVGEMEKALDDMTTSEVSSDAGKDLIKREKYRARRVFAY